MIIEESSRDEANNDISVVEVLGRGVIWKKKKRDWSTLMLKVEGNWIQIVVTFARSGN